MFRTRCSVYTGKLESWVAKNAGWLALGAIAGGFFVYLFFASCCYLNPDEAGHFDAARAPSWMGAYRAALGLAHPPLFILVLHGMLFLGRSEPMIRLPSIIGGCAALWFTFAWLRRSLGAIPALAGAGFMALSPAAISASTEVRQYGLLLCCICGALYTTERAFAERSARWAIAQGLFLLGALLTHYAATVVLLCIGLYCWLRLFRDGVPRRLALTVATCQIVQASVLIWLYFAQVRHGIPFGPGASMDYLQNFYYAGTRETPLAYAWRAMSGTFAYASGRRVAFVFMLVVLAGMAFLLKGRAKAPPWAMGFLVISPFIVGFSASICQIFPFAGSRHQAYLLPFFAAAIAAAFATLGRGLAVLLLLAEALIAPLWLMQVHTANDRRVMPLRDMTATIDYLNRTVPSGAPLFVDAQTRYVLGYYLSRNDKELATVKAPRGVESPLGRFDVVEPIHYVWEFVPGDVLNQVNQAAEVIGVSSRDPVWIASVAWGSPSLASRLPAASGCDLKEFGAISVIKRQPLPQ